MRHAQGRQLTIDERRELPDDAERVVRVADAREIVRGNQPDRVRSLPLGQLDGLQQRGSTLAQMTRRDRDPRPCDKAVDVALAGPRRQRVALVEQRARLLGLTRQRERERGLGREIAALGWIAGVVGQEPESLASALRGGAHVAGDVECARGDQGKPGLPDQRLRLARRHPTALGLGAGRRDPPRMGERLTAPDIRHERRNRQGLLPRRRGLRTLCAVGPLQRLVQRSAARVRHRRR